MFGKNGVFLEQLMYCANRHVRLNYTNNKAIAVDTNIFIFPDFVWFDKDKCTQQQK